MLFPECLKLPRRSFNIIVNLRNVPSCSTDKMILNDLKNNSRILRIITSLSADLYGYGTF